MQSLIERFGVGGYEISGEFTTVRNDVIVGSTKWVGVEGAPDERYAVLTIRDGKIADMQVCGSWRQAKRFANRVPR